MNNITKKIILIVVVMVMLLIFASCGGVYTSDEGCEWCGDTPTKEIEGNYYCKSCVTTCLFCDETADEQFTNGFEIETFVCSDCFAEIQGE